MDTTPFERGRLGAGIRLALAVLVCGCQPIEVEASKPVAAGRSFPGDNSLDTWQSEQSVVRAIDGLTGEPILVVGFNDGGGTLDRLGGLLNNPNKMGSSSERRPMARDEPCS